MKLTLLYHVSCLLNPYFPIMNFIVFLSFLYVANQMTIWENGWTQKENVPHVYEIIIGKISFILETKI